MPMTWKKIFMQLIKNKKNLLRFSRIITFSQIRILYLNNKTTIFFNNLLTFLPNRINLMTTKSFL